MKFAPQAIIGLFFSLCLAATAQAQVITPIPVPNFSFESPALTAGTGDYTYGTNGDTTAVTDWVIVGGTDAYDGGVEDVGGGLFPAGAPDGHQVAWLGSAPAGTGSDLLSTQSLVSAAPLTTFAADTTYTLTLDLGNRADGVADGTSVDGGTYTISILDNGVAVASNTLSGASISAGAFVPLSVSAPTTTVGDALTVQLSITADNGYNQGIFDDVQLSSDGPAEIPPSDVPEPSAWAMIAIGFVSLIGLQRFRRLRS